MGKIFLGSELNCKANQHVIYSDSYEVKFWIKQSSGFWSKESKVYYAKTKSEHEDVLKRWKNDFKNQEVKHISTTYQ